MENVVARSLVAQCGPGEQPSPGIRWRQVYDGDACPECRCRVDGPSVRAEIRVTPLDQRRRCCVFGRIDAKPILSAEKAVIEVTDHLLEGVGCPELEFLTSLDDCLCH